MVGKRMKVVTAGGRQKNIYTERGVCVFECSCTFWLVPTFSHSFILQFLD